jgi:aryl-alcohol dehydrogenase-like predicted oxidoreductase
MDTRKIGSLTVPVVGLGCNNFGWGLDAAQTRRVLDAALDAGVTFFDTADRYGNTDSETYMGEALVGRRDRFILATKFGLPIPDHHPGGGKADYVKSACDASLRRLKTDVIDLYQFHKPDPDVPIAETLGALNELVAAGKVREIGCSNFSVAQLREAKAATAAGAARFVSVQNHFNVFSGADQADVLAECAAENIAYLPFYPLANGFLTGKIRKGAALPSGTRLGGGAFLDKTNEVTPERLDAVERLIGYAESKGRTILELAFGWLLAHPPIASVIAGATKPEQVAGNAAASTWKMTNAERDEIAALAR